MRKRYFIIGALILGLGLNFVPRSVSFVSDEPTWVIETPKVVLQAHGDELVCGMMGMLAGYEYRGLPAMSYVHGGVCGPDRAMYPIGILLNFAVAAGLSGISYLIIKAVIKIRRKS